jgi:hypothetical protein
MKLSCHQRINEQGFVTVVALFMLVVLTMFGISATTTTGIELQIAGNEKAYKIAFYTAEGAMSYAVRRPDLYGPNNITLGEKLYFPNNDDPTEKYLLSSIQSFLGEVEYSGSLAPPRGSGFDVGKFRAHNYTMTSKGFGPSNSESQLETGFYRIGF